MIRTTRSALTTLGAAALLSLGACKVSVDTAQQQPPPPAPGTELPPADAGLPPADAGLPPADPMGGTPELPPVDSAIPEAGAPVLPPPSDLGVTAAPPADPGGRTTVPGLAPPGGGMRDATPVPGSGAPPVAPPPGRPGAPAAALDLPAAIRSSGAQGTVVAAKRKDKRGLISYEIEVLSANGAVTEIELGPDGKPLPAVPGKTKLDPKTAAAASVTKVKIDQAIATALKTSPGSVEEAKLSASKGFATWEVEVRTATGQKAKIKIDAGTGQVVPY